MSDELLTSDAAPEPGKVRKHDGLLGESEDAPAKAAMPSWYTLSKFAEGARAIRREHRLYQRLDLMADLDNIRDQIQQARIVDDEDRVEALLTHAQEVLDTINESTIIFTVEGRSPDRIKELRDEAKRFGYKTPIQTMCWITADSIVGAEDEDVDRPQLADWLVAMSKVIGAQITELNNLVVQISSSTPNVGASVPF